MTDLGMNLSISGTYQKKAATGVDDSGLRQDWLLVLVLRGLQSVPMRGGERRTSGSGGDNVDIAGGCQDPAGRECGGRVLEVRILMGWKSNAGAGWGGDTEP
jgi:hypothetical protein